MKRVFNFALLSIFSVTSILVVSCSNEKSDLYDKAVERIKENLKSPSSAKFEPLTDADVGISERVGKGNPMREATGEDAYGRLSDEAKKGIDRHDSTWYSMAGVTVRYEAQNAFGVFIKGANRVMFKKWHFADGDDSEWQVFLVMDK